MNTPIPYLCLKYENWALNFWKVGMIIFVLNQKGKMWTLNNKLEDQITYKVNSYQGWYT